jgi:hypothetical protein
LTKPKPSAQPRNLHHRTKRNLDFFSEPVRKMLYRIDRMSDKELRVLADAIEKPSSTNCAFWYYHAAKIMWPYVDEEIRRREYKRTHPAGTWHERAEVKVVPRGGK